MKSLKDINNSIDISIEDDTLPFEFDIDEENGCLNIQLNPNLIEEMGLEICE